MKKVIFRVFIIFFSLILINGRGFSADHGTIGSGETRLNNIIANPSSLDTWTFQGTQNDRVVISAVATSGNLDTRVIVYPPSGGATEAASVYTCPAPGICYWPDQLDWQLRQTGLYTIVIEDGGLTNTGTYNISLLKMPGLINSAADPDGGPIASGQTRSGTIGVAADMDAFQFYGSSGDRVIINAVTTSGNLDTRITLYPPGGGAAEAASAYTCPAPGVCYWPDQLDWQLRQTGLYTIVIEDGGLTNTGTYNISFLKMPGLINSAADPDGGSIASGQTRSGAINVPSDMDAFQFYGSSGDRVIINAVTTSGNLDTRLTLYPPGSGAAEAASVYTCPAPGVCFWPDNLDWQLRQTGLYTIVIEDGGLTNTGTYNVSLTKIPPVPPLSINNPYPPNGATISNLNGAFSWDPVPGATGYDLYFSADAATPLAQVGFDLPPPSMTFPLMQVGQMYYWQVMAHIPGGRPVCIDSHVEDNTPYYASIWTYDPATKWRAAHNQPLSEYEQTSAQLSARGYRLIKIDTQVIDNIPYYTSVWIHDPATSWAVFLGQTAGAYQNTVTQQAANGYRLISVNTHVINDVPYYASIWILDPTAEWQARHGQTAGEFQQTIDQMSALSYRPLDIDTYVMNNNPYYASVWIHDPTALWASFYGQTTGEYQNTADQEISNDYRPIVVNTHVINNVPYYASIWVKNDGTSWAARHGQTSSDYKKTFNQLGGIIEGPYWWFSVIPPDTAPPTPNPMTWAVQPAAASSTAITMTAATATDAESPPVQYFFNFTDSPTGGAGGADSGWQNGTGYTSSGLQPNHQYGYRVKARDSASTPIETTYSNTVYKFTKANAPLAAAFSNITQTSLQANWTANGNRAGTEYYVENTTRGTNSGWVTTLSWSETGLTAGTSYTYRVKGRNGDLIEETGWTSLGSQSTTTCPGLATPGNPNPADGGTGVSVSPTLTWTASGADSYDVYFGTAASPPFVTNTVHANYHPTGLSAGATYYWQIVAKNNCGQSAAGPVWNFVTGSTSGKGKIVVVNDDWVLSDAGFAAPNDPGKFATNIAAWFTGSRAGKFHAYSDHFGLTGTSLAQAMANAGHTWTTGTVGFTFDLTTLQQYDGIFLLEAPADKDVLINYVEAGGNVYLAYSGDGSHLDEQYNTLVNHFGLGLGIINNGIAGNVAISSTHPIFAGVDSLYNVNGSDIVDLAPTDARQVVLVSQNGHGLYAVYNGEEIPVVLFSDDFESYAQGTFPGSGGWQLIFNGRGPSYQYVDNSHAASGSKSLHLMGSSCWSADAYHPVTLPALVKLEADVLVDQMVTCGCTPILGALNLNDPLCANDRETPTP